MKEANTIIFDMTNKQTLVGVVSKTGDVVLVEDFEPDFRVVLAKLDGEIIARAGAETDQTTGSVPLLVFDHLNQCLPLIEDEELQARLIGSFWTFLVRAAMARGLIDPLGKVTGYVLVPHNWPLPELECFREACAAGDWIRLVGFPNEAASLVVGTLQHSMFRSSVQHGLPEPLAACLIASHNDGVVEVCFFEYSSVEQLKHRIFIGDFFRTNCSELAGELRARDWCRPNLTVVSLESSKLSARSNKSLAKAFEDLSLGPVRNQCLPAELLALKMSGAAYIARCCEGRSSDSTIYDLETAYSIELQTNAASSLPILTQRSLAFAARFPVSSSRAFRLSDRLIGALRLKSRCGYSNRVDESTHLGDFIVLPEIHKAAGGSQTLSAVVRLDSRGSGELTLESRAAQLVIGSLAFTLPGLMV